MMSGSNINLTQFSIESNTKSVVEILKTSQKRKESQKSAKIKAVYTDATIKKMSSNLYNALNDRCKYESVVDLQSIYDNKDIGIYNYEKYESLCISLFTHDFKKAEYNLYSEKILSRHVCQYCYVQSVNALDHYIEKAKFPELSILPDNLIPICTNCNSTKKDNFVYPYFNILQNSEWLGCTVNSDQTFRFSISKEVASNEFEKKILIDLRNQFDTLKIFDKYIKSGQATVTDRFSMIKILKETGKKRDDTKNFFEESDIKTNKILLSNTEFYLIAIRKAIIKNFYNIWDAL